MLNLMQEFEGESRDREAGGNDDIFGTNFRSKDDIFGANFRSKDDMEGRFVQQEYAQPPLSATSD